MTYTAELWGGLVVQNLDGPSGWSQAPPPVHREALQQSPEHYRNTSEHREQKPQPSQTTLEWVRGCSTLMCFLERAQSGMSGFYSSFAQSRLFFLCWIRWKTFWGCSLLWLSSRIKNREPPLSLQASPWPCPSTQELFVAAAVAPTAQEGMGDSGTLVQLWSAAVVSNRGPALSSDDNTGPSICFLTSKGHTTKGQWWGRGVQEDDLWWALLPCTHMKQRHKPRYSN